MTAVYCVAWATIGAVTAWAIVAARSSALIARLRAEARREISHWQAEASRARITAAQLARDAATRARAWKEARDEVIAIMPMIVSARDGNAGPRLAADDETKST
jgi:hypothetical protein